MKLRAVRNFHINDVPLKVGDIVEFDGKRTVVINGASYECPQVRGAIKAEWLVGEPVENLPKSPTLF